MWRGQSLSVVLPTFNEVGSILDCIQRFERLGVVDEIVVVNNNAAPGTSEAVRQTSAIEIFESIQGYGAALLRGLAAATGDLVCLCEPDGTFDPEDLEKLLPFSRDVDQVLGSRTVQTFVWSGANMGPFLRWGNWFVAKLIELLYNTVYLSDVGCTFRLLKRPIVDEVLRTSVSTGSTAGLEILLLSVKRRHRFVQVPVRYLPRIGESAVTGSFWHAFALGGRMIHLVLQGRVGLWPRSRRDTPRGVPRARPR
jgi:glycosyltransferase involved in cell wall biosynthesis